MPPPSFIHPLSRLETCFQPISVMSIRSDETRRCSEPVYERGMQAGAGKILVRTLLEIHVQQPPAHPHASESPGQRAYETTRTVASAFSRPARPQMKTQISRQLPNSVREALFQLKRTDVVRTLEGLRHKGIQPGQTIAAAEAKALLKGIVGQDSIYHALNAQTPDGQPIFEPISPLATPIAPNGAAKSTNKELSTKCFIGRAEIPRIIQSGRKKRVFVMPTNLELCQQLSVKPSGSDPITLDDLATAKQTRMAVHREMIKRRPGIYPRRWLAGRVGVCTDTLDTYNRDIPIGVKHLFLETRLNWSNLSHVPDNIPIDGAFLEDDTGKRYPPRRHIVAHLLGQGKRVIYKRQDANYYWYGETPPNLSVLLGVHPQRPEMDARLKAIQAYTHIRQSEPTVPSKQAAVVNHNESVRPISVQVAATSPKKTRRRNYRKFLTDPSAEALAEQVYTAINTLSTNTAAHISRTTARRLVDQYGTQKVGQGVSLISKRRNILIPAGFLVSWLRSESHQLQAAQR